MIESLFYIINHHCILFDCKIEVYSLCILKWCIITKYTYIYALTGGGYDGANCNKILKKVENLEECLKESNDGTRLMPLIEGLRNFKLVVADCFGSELKPTYKDTLTIFGQCYINLVDWAENSLQQKLTVTWKVHILIAHLHQFIAIKNEGLAPYAEQAGEAVHAKFKSTWQRYKRNVNHTEHGIQLQRAVSEFSSRRK